MSIYRGKSQHSYRIIAIENSHHLKETISIVYNIADSLFSDNWIDTNRIESCRIESGGWTMTY